MHTNFIGFSLLQAISYKHGSCCFPKLLFSLPQAASVYLVSAPASAAPADDMAAFKAKVEKLTVMKDAGLITEDEFKTMKTQLLASIM